MMSKRIPLILAVCVTACDFGSDRGATHTAAMAPCTDKRGEVRSHPAALATWSPLASGNELAQGDWVQTAADAFAKIELFTGGLIEIEPSSVVVLEEEGEGETKERMVGLVALRSGR